MDEGHGQRVAQLAERYGRMVFATTYRILGNADDAEDAMQEVFLKLVGAWDGKLEAAPVADWGAYLRVMAARCAVDLLRRRSKWSRESEPLREELTAADEPGPDRAVRRRQQADLLRRALAKLRTRDARIFALRYFEQMSYEAIAAEMGLSVNQVGVVLHRARKRLRRVLDQHAHGTPVSQRSGRSNHHGEPEEGI